MNALFLAGHHRPDTLVHLVLESSADYPRTLTYDGSLISDLGGFSEQTLLNSIVHSLGQGAQLKPGMEKRTEQGVLVRPQGFDKLMKALADSQRNLLVLARKGSDIRQTEAIKGGCFILTDHIPMPSKSLKYLNRLGARKISLGPQELFASQCITLIHNELDRAST